MGNAPPLHHYGSTGTGPLEAIERPIASRYAMLFSASSRVTGNARGPATAVGSLMAAILLVFAARLQFPACWSSAGCSLSRPSTPLRCTTAVAEAAAQVMTMSSTLAPRDRSLIGLAKPCRNGP